MSPGQRETAASTAAAPKATSTVTDTQHGSSRSGQKHTYTYRVSYKRADWVDPQNRYYSRRHDAQRRIDGLLSDLTHEGRYQPIVSITLDRRPVISQWEKVAGWEESP